ncbi:hypothetical protein LXL04_020606 [Taraxacum kok-saghyz]
MKGVKRKWCIAERQKESTTLNLLNAKIKALEIEVEGRLLTKDEMRSTREDKIKIVEHGDPLSLFLFIIVMDGLNVVMKFVVSNSIFARVEVGDNQMKISHLFYVDGAIFLGCGAKTIPFVYLRLPIGENMKWENSWEPLIDKFRVRLSKWKERLLSIGGRL